MMMALYKRFDVVVIPFPFVDSELSKKRPALILSAEKFNLETDMVTCAMITSSEEKWSSDVEIQNLQKAGLKKKCKARFKIFSIQSNLIICTAGHLDKKDQERVKSSFSAIFND